MLEKNESSSKLVTNMINDDEVEWFELHVHQYQVDNRFPSTETSDVEKVRIDHWWAAVDKLGKYCVIVKMIKALLSCFHGPQVESSFSSMGDTIDSKSSRMNISTYTSL